MAVIVVVVVATLLIEAAVPGFIRFVWNDIIVAGLEEVFSWIGITDETVVQVSKVSTKILGTEVSSQQVKKAKTAALISFLKQEGSFWKHMRRELVTPTVKVDSYYKSAERGQYIHGLPEMEVRGTEIDYAAIGSAVNSEFGGTNEIIFANSGILPAEMKFKNELQLAPNFYKPGLDTLTHTDDLGNIFNDWKWKKVELNDTSGQYEITVVREAELAVFNIFGPDSVVEGSSINFTCKCNRVLTEQVTLNFSYSGTLSANQFTEVASVTMLTGTDSIDVPIPITEDAISESVETLVVTLTSITNTVNGFEAVSIGGFSEIAVNVFDNEGIVLSLNSVTVDESETSVTIPVTLNNAVAGGFTVDYSMSDITAVGGIDYNNSPGTLSFSGSNGEVQNIIIPLSPDVIQGSKEEFLVSLSNCSNNTVNTQMEAKVALISNSYASSAPGTTQYESVIVKPNYTPERRMWIAYRNISNNPNDWYLWIYDTSTEQYPIDPTSSGISSLDMLPVVILRKEKVSINSNKGSEEYKSARKLALKLGIKIDDVIKGVEESENDEGDKNIDQIDDVYINFALDPEDSNPSVSKLLWETFYYIVVTAGITSNSNRYTGVFREQDVNAAMVWTDQEYTVDISGTVADVGKYNHSVTTLELPEFDRNGDPVFEENDSDEEPVQSTYTACYLDIKYQKTNALYDQIRIINLSSISAIAYDGYHKVASSQLGITDEKLTIPLSYSAFNALTHEEVLEAYPDIFRLDIFAIAITDVEWYQTEAFWNFMKIVGIILTIISFGTAGSIYLAFAQLAAQFLVYKLVVYIVEITGNATLAAIVGVIALIVLGQTLGLPPIDFTTAEGLTKAVTAFSNNLDVAGNTVLEQFQEDLDELNKEFQDTMKQYDQSADPIIDGSDYVNLRSVDSYIAQGIDLQYQFDAAISGNYDRLVNDYYDNLLQLGVV